MYIYIYIYIISLCLVKSLKFYPSCSFDWVYIMHLLTAMQEICGLYHELVLQLRSMTRITLPHPVPRRRKLATLNLVSCSVWTQLTVTNQWASRVKGK